VSKYLGGEGADCVFWFKLIWRKYGGYCGKKLAPFQTFLVLEGLIKRLKPTLLA